MCSNNSGIQGKTLNIRVVSCAKLKNTEMFTKQDPYICFEYGETKLRTKTCKDGGKNPTYDDNFQITLIEGLKDISVNVWNSNTFTSHDFIGSGRISLYKVITEGLDYSAWPLKTNDSKYAGDVNLIMKLTDPQKPCASSTTWIAPPSPSVCPTCPTVGGSYYPTAPPNPAQPFPYVPTAVPHQCTPPCPRPYYNPPNPAQNFHYYEPTAPHYQHPPPSPNHYYNPPNPATFQPQYPPSYNSSGFFGVYYPPR